MASLVVVGASQGGVEAIHRLVGDLPADFPAAILVVVHVGLGPSMLPSILNDLRKLPASHAVAGQLIERGHIYVAPPDRHMVVTDGHLELTRGPRENWTRPAVDPLFRSAAEMFGAEAIGVILTGGLNDGTTGLYEIKRRGGTTIVQDPAEAQAPSMPQSAMENVAIDYCLPLPKMAEALVRLTRSEKKTERELRPGVRIMLSDERPLEHPTAQTWPECGGAMRKEKIGKLTQYRCHIGHVMTGEVLAAAELETLEYNVSSVLRSRNERRDLCLGMASQQRANDNSAAERRWSAAAEEARQREVDFRPMAEAQWLRPDRRERG
jgi:two-component system chemotaxis response regulator CheB